MKESITKFDLEAAFRALDAIEPPKAKRLKANRTVLSEKLTALPKMEALLEEYYDIGNTEELETAKEDREAEVAKAKLARIEKIVDLDAESPDELLASYVGKYIIQCPQCMTLFYKNKEDIIESEDDETTVNINEVCQHCGNESGYTLVGKVGAADEPVDETAEEAQTEEGSEEDLNLDDDFADLDFGDETDDVSDEVPEDPDASEDDEFADLDLEIEDDETEEAKEESFKTSYLNTPLTEDVDVSAGEFKSLISSPEFKKPISSAEVHSMLQDLGESTEEVSTEDDHSEKDEEVLTEGAKDVLKKAIDKIATALKSRESKADWILENALEDNGVVTIDNKGKLIPDKDDRRFFVFVVIGFQEAYKNGKRITMAPSWDCPDLLVGKNGVKTFEKYKAADAFAKGWSQRQGNGPAFIYLAKDEDDENAIFLCEYFGGDIVKAKDQLDKYFELVKKDVEGAKLMAQNDAGSETTSDDDNAKGINKGADTDADAGTDNAGDTEVTEESLSTIMDSLENLNEECLAKHITESLITKYSNVAGFKIKDCSFINESLDVSGVILFTSGNMRETTYSFTEAFVSTDDKIVLKGLNEKLGLDKDFVLTATKDAESKTLITEAFKAVIR